MKNKLNILLILPLFLAIGLACNLAENQSDNPSSKPRAEKKPATERIDGYTIRGLEFAYYKIPADLGCDELVAIAQKLHEEEPKAQLILVDDTSRVRDYIDYAKAVSAGNYELELPKDWADAHIVANVQKMMSGKFVLYEGYGYKEIAELKN